MADFEGVFTAHQSMIFKYLLKLCGDRMLAEELTQETFFRAYMNFRQLRDENKAAAWLCRIAKNTFFAWCREQRKTLPLEEALLPGAPDVAEKVAARTLTDAAFAALRKLDEPYREVFELAVFAEIPLREISALFGKSESWARVTFHRARRQLLEMMGEST